MKLKRRWSRICVVAVAAAILFALLLGITGRVEFYALVILSLLAILLARLGGLRCKNCGKGLGPVRWNPGKRYYCPYCGKPFIFDDEPDEPDGQ